MLNFLTTFGADSQFQKNRLLLTKINYQSPNEQAIRNILRSFAGQDEQTRSQIAFACMIKKIHNSNSKDNWVYLLKNLIILDRVISDNRFCQELSQIKLQTVQNFIDSDIKSVAINAKKLLKDYWELIRDICRLKISNKHILHFKRSQRKEYLQNLNTHQILNQILILQKLFNNCCSLVFLTSGISNNSFQQQQITANQKTKKYYNQFVNSKLAQYLNIHFYSKLLTFFSCQYLCIHKFIQIIMQITKNETKLVFQDVKYFKQTVFKFKQNCNNMIKLVDKNRDKKGFQQVQTKQFFTFSQDHIIKIINQFYQHNQQISQRYNRQQNYTNISQNLLLQSLFSQSSKYLKLPAQKFVNRKPFICDNLYSVRNKSPRKFIDCNDQKQENKFQDYFNFYSEQFPHKNMMTIDLIEDIRRDNQLQYQRILQPDLRPSSNISRYSKQSNVQIYDEQNQNILENRKRDIFINQQALKISQQQKMNGNKKQKSTRNEFFKQFKKLKAKTKLTDLLILDKNLQNLLNQQKQNSTDYSYKNSARKSLFEVLNIKYQSQQSHA